jgi:hypothetical protein
MVAKRQNKNRITLARRHPVMYAICMHKGHTTRFSERVILRATQQQLRRWARQAKLANATLSAWIRDAADLASGKKVSP